MAYCTPAQMLLRYDARRVGQLVGDEGLDVAPGDLLTDPVLLALLTDASAWVDSEALVGRRYTTTDLAGLTDQAASLLIRLTADLTYGLLVQRRGFSQEEVSRLAPSFKLALGLLERLRYGQSIFALEAVAAAGDTIELVAPSLQPRVTSQTRIFGVLNTRVS